MDLPSQTLVIARTQIGVKEATGNNDGIPVQMYQDYVGKWVEGLPWCACFVSWCIGQAALTLGVTTKFARECSVPRMAIQAKKKKLWLDKPIPGCILLLKDEQGNYEHTGFVESVDWNAGIVHSIDGNWSNKVCRTSHSITRCDFMAIT